MENLLEKDNEIIFNILSKSKFRAKFRLKEKDIKYIIKNGWETVNRHANDFIINRLSRINETDNKLKDGKQTPFKGHPVFIAQHALGMCCRKCLKKWYNIPENRHLQSEEIERLKDIIIEWLKLNI